MRLLFHKGVPITGTLLAVAAQIEVGEPACRRAFCFRVSAVRVHDRSLHSVKGRSVEHYLRAMISFVQRWPFRQYRVTTPAERAESAGDAVEDITAEFLMLILLAAMLYFAGEAVRFFWPSSDERVDDNGGISIFPLVDAFSGFRRGDNAWAIPGEASSLRGSLRTSYGTLRTGDRAAASRVTYEDLLALGDEIGSVNNGLTESQIAVFPTRTYVEGDNVEEMRSCAICMEPFENGDIVQTLPCTEQFHREYVCAHSASIKF